MMIPTTKNGGILMSVSFAESQTKTNLLRAFAGESQARNRYTFAAGLARKNDLYVLEAVFQFTASQELAHAKAFYDYLEGCSGENIPIDGAYPIDLYPTLLEHLRSAQHNEYQEYEQDYTGFAHTAKEEGFPDRPHRADPRGPVRPLCRSFRAGQALHQRRGVPVDVPQLRLCGHRHPPSGALPRLQAPPGLLSPPGALPLSGLSAPIG
jgi:rubrerythrin